MDPSATRVFGFTACTMGPTTSNRTGCRRSLRVGVADSPMRQRADNRWTTDLNVSAGQ